MKGKIDLNFIATVKNQLKNVILDAYKKTAFEQIDLAPVIEMPKLKANGDFSTPFALSLARPLKQNPRAIADRKSTRLNSSH